MKKERPHRVPSGADYAAARHRMVSYQLEARGITDRRVLHAMRAVPRHLFVPPPYRENAYDDRPLPIGCDQTISQPYMVAIMTQLLQLRPADTVLEVGTGSGYQAAVLAALAAHVVTIERHGALVNAARKALQSAGIANVTLVEGDGTLGYPEEAPYDAIIVTAGGPDVPEPLIAQLASGGRLVCPVGSRAVQTVVRITKTDGGLRREEDVECMFVPLLGQKGWSEE